MPSPQITIKTGTLLTCVAPANTIAFYITNLEKLKNNLVFASKEFPEYARFIPGECILATGESILVDVSYEFVGALNREILKFQVFLDLKSNKRFIFSADFNFSDGSCGRTKFFDRLLTDEI
jgi:hypothetical protein